MFSHTAYGLGISSPFPLPELLPGDGHPDVMVRLAFPKRVSRDDAMGTEPNGSAHEAVLSWDDVGTFVVRNGNEIVVSPAPNVEGQLLRTFLLGPVLPVLLRQRGFLVLHASAVAVGHQVFLFMGGSGWGKSTLAAALCQQGYSLLSDDVTAIDMNTPHPTVIPGYPQVKLWPDSVRALGQDPELLPRLNGSSEKRVSRNLSNFCQDPLPLARVFVLDDGTNLQITDLEPQAALVELVRHSSRVRELHTNCAPAHLRQCATIVNSVPLSRLTVPRSFSALSTVVSTLAEEALHVA